MGSTARERILSGAVLTEDLLDQFEKEARQGTVTVEVDPDLHNQEPRSEGRRLTWEAVDTAWNLLRVHAVRIAINEIREGCIDQGLGVLPSDEEIFAAMQESGVEDAPTSYLDLAPQVGETELVDMAMEGLRGVFHMLTEQALVDSVHGVAMSQAELGE